MQILFTFLKCKMVIQGQHRDDVDDIKCATTRQLKNQTSQDVERCFFNNEDQNGTSA